MAKETCIGSERPSKRLDWRAMCAALALHALFGVAGLVVWLGLLDWHRGSESTVNALFLGLVFGIFAWIVALVPVAWPAGGRSRTGLRFLIPVVGFTLWCAGLVVILD